MVDGQQAGQLNAAINCTVQQHDSTVFMKHPYDSV